MCFRAFVVGVLLETQRYTKSYFVLEDAQCIKSISESSSDMYKSTNTARPP